MRYHVQPTPNYLAGMIAEAPQKLALYMPDFDGSADEAIDELHKSTFEVVPVDECDNYNKRTGRCMGHVGG